MTSVGRIKKLLGYIVAVSAVLWATSAEAKVNKAVVRAVRGSADYSSDKGSTWKPIKVNTALGPNSIVKTAAGSTVDLFLGDNGPVVRVTESTSLGIDKLDVEETGAEKVIETQLDLKNGRILGNVKKLASTSKYEVKTPVGVAAIRGTEFDISASGTLHVVSGTVTIVYVNPVTGVVSPPVVVTAGNTAMPPTGGGVNATVTPTAPGATGDFQGLNVVNNNGGSTVIVLTTPVNNNSESPNPTAAQNNSTKVLIATTNGIVVGDVSVKDGQISVTTNGVPVNGGSIIIGGTTNTLPINTNGVVTQSVP